MRVGNPLCRVFYFGGKEPLQKPTGEQKEREEVKSCSPFVFAEIEEKSSNIGTKLRQNTLTYKEKHDNIINCIILSIFIFSNSIISFYLIILIFKLLFASATSFVAYIIIFLFSFSNISVLQ